jgi:hypothetical protein
MSGSLGIDPGLTSGAAVLLGEDGLLDWTDPCWYTWQQLHRKKGTVWRVRNAKGEWTANSPFTALRIGRNRTHMTMAIPDVLAVELIFAQSRPQMGLVALAEAAGAAVQLYWGAPKVIRPSAASWRKHVLCIPGNTKAKEADRAARAHIIRTCGGLPRKRYGEREERLTSVEVGALVDATCIAMYALDGLHSDSACSTERGAR